MSLAAFGARMPYDEALGSLVGAKKMDRNGKVSTKTSLIRCKFWNVLQVTSCFLGSVSAVSIFKPLCVKKLQHLGVWSQHLRIDTIAKLCCSTSPFPGGVKLMTSGCGCLHPTGDGCSWFWASHKGEDIPIERNLEGRMTPTENGDQMARIWIFY